VLVVFAGEGLAQAVLDSHQSHRCAAAILEAVASFSHGDLSLELKPFPFFPSKFVITDDIFLSQVNFDDTGDFYGQDKQGFPRDYNGAAEDNLEVEGPVRRQPDPPNAQGMRSRCLYVIDLEKPAALDDDVEILSSRCFINYGTCNSFSLDNSQCVPLENSPVMGDLCRDHNTPYASHGQFMELLIVALLTLLCLLIEDIPPSFVHIISPKSEPFTAK
jgi:hypothetical protein